MIESSEATWRPKHVAPTTKRRTWEAVAAVAAVVVAGITLYQAKSDTEVVHKSTVSQQVTDRYNIAMSQLSQAGDGNRSLRVGAVDSLEGLISSAELKPQIVRVLADFLQRSAPRPATLPSDADAVPKAPADVLEAFRVLATHPATDRLDLGNTLLGLPGIKVPGAHLPGVFLQNANLRGADLSHADLQDANLQDAGLGGANLSGANLSGADLGGAYLGSADLSGTDLRGAKFSTNWQVQLRCVRLNGDTLLPPGVVQSTPPKNVLECRK